MERGVTLGAWRPPLPRLPREPCRPSAWDPSHRRRRPTRRPPSPAWPGAWDVRGGGNFPPLECPRGRCDRSRSSQAARAHAGLAGSSPVSEARASAQMASRSCFDFVLICCVPPPPQPPCHSMLSCEPAAAQVACLLPPKVLRSREEETFLNGRGTKMSGGPKEGMLLPKAEMPSAACLHTHLVSFEQRKGTFPREMERMDQTCNCRYRLASPY